MSRSRFLMPLVLVVLAADLAAAAPIEPPFVSDTYDWQSGEPRSFELTWNGSLATFDVEGVGRGIYTSLDSCCADMFSRVKQVYPGGTLQFSGLAINTYPVNMVVTDNLDLTLLKQGGFDNLATLTGFVTLFWDSPAAGMPQLVFDGGTVGFSTAMTAQASPTDTPIPEPATLALVGSGLVGASWILRGRRRSE